MYWTFSLGIFELENLQNCCKPKMPYYSSLWCVEFRCAKNGKNGGTSSSLANSIFVVVRGRKSRNVACIKSIFVKQKHLISFYFLSSELLHGLAHTPIHLLVIRRVLVETTSPLLRVLLLPPSYLLQRATPQQF